MYYCITGHKNDWVRVEAVVQLHFYASKDKYNFSAWKQENVIKISPTAITIQVETDFWKCLKCYSGFIIDKYIINEHFLSQMVYKSTLNKVWIIFP